MNSKKIIVKNIFYFQRYSQKENWVTNNTLLLLSRLYQHSRLKFENVLNTLLADDNLSIDIGVRFSQQQKAKQSIPDGVILQSDFKLAIETKLYDNFELDQLERHFEAFDNPGAKILLALSKGDFSKDQRSHINKKLKDSKKDIKFGATSFKQLADVIGENLSDYDIEMNEILDDYISFCEETGLIHRTAQTLLVFTAGQSLKENFKYNLYYDAITRNHNLPFKYVGLYNNKSVVGIGELKKVVYCNYEKGGLQSSNGEALDIDKGERERIQKTIEETDYYDLTKDTKFYLVDKFIPTSYKKVSWSSLRMKRYFFLDEIEGFKKEMGAEEIAKLLNGKTWE